MSGRIQGSCVIALAVLVATSLGTSAETLSQPAVASEKKLDSILIEGESRSQVTQFNQIVRNATGNLLYLETTGERGGRTAHFVADPRIVSAWDEQKRQLSERYGAHECAEHNEDARLADEALTDTFRARVGLLNFLVNNVEAAGLPADSLTLRLTDRTETPFGEFDSCERRFCQTVSLDQLEQLKTLVDRELTTVLARGQYCSDFPLHDALSEGLRGSVVARTVLHVIGHEIAELTVNRFTVDTYPATGRYDKIHPIAERVASAITGVNMFKATDPTEICFPFHNCSYTPAARKRAVIDSESKPVRFMFGGGGLQWRVDLIWLTKENRFSADLTQVTLDLARYVRQGRNPDCACN